MSKRAHARPNAPHRIDIQRIERADGIDIKVERAAIPADRALEFFIPQEQRACDDAGLELKQHHGARLRVQPRRWVSKPPVAGREVAEKATLLHLLDAQ